MEGLDANWANQSITIALDATDPQADQVAVITASGSETWMRVNRAYVSGGTASVGDIYIADEVPGTWTAGGLPGTLSNTLAFISIADQQTEQAIYSTAAGKTGRLVSWEITVESSQATDARLQIREFGGVFRTKSNVINLSNITYKKTYETFMRVPPKSDIKIHAKAQATTSSAVAEFDMYTDT